MQIKQHFSQYIQQVEQTLSPIEELKADITKTVEIGNQIKKGELIVPVVGGFSSGKSTLINNFLGSTLLPTSIRPETAIAAELRYCEEEYIEAIKDEKATRYSLSQLAEIKDNGQNFDYLKIFLNNANLKAIAPLVLVDMPGFGAFNEEHNKAIKTYYVSGNYFIFLTDCTAGTITRDMERTISDLKEIGAGFSFCLSKTNLRPASDVDEVAEQMSEHLQDLCDYDKELVRLDFDGGKNLQRILADIDPEMLFKQIYQPRLESLHSGLKGSINTRVSTLKENKEELEGVQTRLTKQISDLEKRRKHSVLRVESYCENANRGIVQRIHSTLLEQQGNLVTTAMRNQSAFAVELNDLVKDVSLREVKKQFERIREEAIADIESEIEANFSGLNGVSFSNFAADLKLDNINLNTPTVAPTPTVDKDMLQTIKNMADILGNIVPVLKPVTKVVSTIASIASAIFGGGETRVEQPQISQADIEANQRRQIETQYQTVILPKIKYELEAKLPEVLKENISGLIDEINKQFGEKVQSRQREIEQELQHKTAPATEIEQRIVVLNQIATKLDQLSEQYLTR